MGEFPDGSEFAGSGFGDDGFVEIDPGVREDCFSRDGGNSQIGTFKLSAQFVDESQVYSFKLEVVAFGGVG